MVAQQNLFSQPQNNNNNVAELLLKQLIGDSLNKVTEEAKQTVTDTQNFVKEEITKLKEVVNKNIELYNTDKPLIVNLGTIEKPKNKLVHKAFKTIIKILQSAKRKEKNIMLVGEAGSGKTKLVSDVADAMKLKFYPMSVGQQTTKSDLLGFINAHGEYVTSPIREAYEKGGVLLLDEFDAAHPGVVTILNSLLANGHCSFPDKIVEKNEKFVCICACNTYGKGANIEYVGRNRLDAATLDRFIVIDVDYDTKLEKKLCGNEQWYEIIKQIRSNAKKNGIKVIISPRATMDGADLLENGFSMKEVIEMTILKGANSDTKNKLLKDVDLDKAVEPEPEPDNEPAEPTTQKRVAKILFDENELYYAIAGIEVTNKANKFTLLNEKRDIVYTFYLSKGYTNTRYASEMYLNDMAHSVEKIMPNKFISTEFREIFKSGAIHSFITSPELKDFATLQIILRYADGEEETFTITNDDFLKSIQGE